MTDPHKWTLEQVEDLLRLNSVRVICDALNATTHALRLENAGLRRQLAYRPASGSMLNAINAVRVTSPLLADQIEQAFKDTLTGAAERKATQIQGKELRQLRDQLAAERENGTRLACELSTAKTQLAAEKEKQEEAKEVLNAERRGCDAWKESVERNFNTQLADEQGKLRNLLEHHARTSPTQSAILVIDDLKRQLADERERTTMHVRNWDKMLDDKQQQLAAAVEALRLISTIRPDLVASAALAKIREGK